MTTNVTFHDSDSPGTRLMKLEQQVFLDRPSLNRADPSDRAFARDLVRQANQDLWQLHHHGLQAAPEETVDGGLMLPASAPTLAAGYQPGRGLSEGLHEARPDGSRRGTAARCCRPTRPRQHEDPEPARRSSDPGLEVMRLTQERMASDPALTVDQARHEVLAADPVLRQHYAEATPLPLTPRPSRPTSDQLIEEQLVQLRQMQAELAAVAKQVAPPARRHFSHSARPSGAATCRSAVSRPATRSSSPARSWSTRWAPTPPVAASSP